MRMSEKNDANKILNDIRTYLRISAAVASRGIASKVLDTQEKAQVYEKLCEGAPQAKIEAATSVPQQIISRWINEFVEAGLVTPPNEFSRNYTALFTLRELAINTSELAKRKKRQQAEAKAKKTDEGEEAIKGEISKWAIKQTNSSK
jgi:DNA-binding transcriptional ArsR family regulator